MCKKDVIKILVGSLNQAGMKGRLSEKTGVQCCAVRLQSTGDTA